MIALFLSTAFATPTPLTVDQAVERALAQASDYRVAQDDEEMAAGEVKSERARLAPALGIEGSVVFNSPATGIPDTPSFVSEDGVMWSRAVGGVTGTLFGGGGGQVKADKALLAAAHAGTEVARRALARAAIEAYFGLALAEAQGATAEQNATVAADLARVTSLRFTAGEVPEVDVLRTHLLAVARGDELLQVRAAEAEAAAELGVLIGTDGEWAVVDLQTLEADPAAVDALVHALGDDPQVPEVAAASAQVDAAQALVRATRSEYLPTVDYLVGYGFDTDTFGTDFSHHLGFIGGVNVSVPIFDWGLGRHSVQAAKLAADQSTAVREQAARTAAADRQIAESTARAAAERHRILAESLPDAERNVEISLARYEAGEADLLEVTEAQQMLIDTRYATNGALADYQTALARLRLLVGP